MEYAHKNNIGFEPSFVSSPEEGPSVNASSGAEDWIDLGNLDNMPTTQKDKRESLLQVPNNRSETWTDLDTSHQGVFMGTYEEYI